MKESLDAIEENILYIDKIISDLQDYTRPLIPDAKETNLKELIDNTLLKVNIPKNIRVEANIGANMLLKVDAAYLRRVFTNLIVNAVQAMSNGGKLIIEADTKADKAVISIKDTGVGITEKVKPNLFTPLFTTKSKGQGLGLAVVKRLVEAQGGTVRFESKEGKGTTFIIELNL